jgi:D-glycero-D-manno-heptose 1,7-bisphosphate phosphatase
MNDQTRAGQPAVFLDRDGTLIEEVGYLNRLERLRFFPWTVDAVRVLNQAGLAVVVITNQSGVGQGYFDEAFLHRLHGTIDERMREGRARIDGYYYCPHHPQAKLEQYRIACECRKPKPGLIHQAARELGLDVTRSFMVGDRWGDIDLAHAAGATSVLVRCGYLHEDDQPPATGRGADAAFDNLMEAASWIIRAARLQESRDGSDGLRQNR